MLKALVYGAGSIGLGCIGQMLHDSGYEVVFADVVHPIVNEINKRKNYTLVTAFNEHQKRHTIDNVRAVNAGRRKSVAREIAEADIIALTVNINVLADIVPTLAEGLRLRFKEDRPPVNILFCQDAMDISNYVKGMLWGVLEEKYMTRLSEKAALVDLVRDRMTLTYHNQREDILTISVEPYSHYIIDKETFIGEGNLAHARIFSPIRLYQLRRLYVQDFARVMAAYYGRLYGYHYIWQAMQDDDIVEEVSAVMRCSLMALRQCFGDTEIKMKFIDNQIMRMSNHGLMHTTAQGGKNPLAKIKQFGCLNGALALCVEQKISYSPVLKAIAAAMRFSYEDDPDSLKMNDMIQTKGAAKFIAEWGSIGNLDAEQIGMYYELLQNP